MNTDKVNKAVKLCMQMAAMYKKLKKLEFAMSTEELIEYRKRTA